ncbi:MAG: hypothetical protein AABZ47_00690 [Planctomycetota bacterium]
MIRYECDMCGVGLKANDSSRYIVKMEIYAAAGPLDLDAHADGDTEGELSKVIESLSTADPGDMEDRTYRSFRFDVCDSCRKALLLKPIGR